MFEHSDVEEFTRKALRLKVAEHPSLLDGEHVEFRIGAMLEEVEEFKEAHLRGDVASAADALVDLVYFAHGTAVLMGIPWDEVWKEVHRANMEKRLGRTKREHGFDAMKPEGWNPPDHSAAVGKGPWGVHTVEAE